MKKTFLGLMLLLTATFAWAQKATIKWGEEDAKELSFGSLIKGSGTDMIKLCFDKKVKGIKTPVLTRYNDKLELQAEKIIAVNETGVTYNNLISVKGKVFLITSQFDKATNATTYFAQAINTETLNMDGDVINLGGTSLIKSPGFQFSVDSSKILMFGKAQNKEGANAKYYINVLDNNMQKLWSKDVELPYGVKNIILEDVILTKYGEVGVVIRRYDLEVSESGIKNSEMFGQKVPEYEMKMLLYNKENKNPVEYSLDQGDKFVHSVQIMDDNIGNIQLFELYKQKVNAGCITGFFIATIDKKNSKVTVTEPIQFPKELVTLVDKDKQARDNQKDPGLAPSFNIVGVEERANGSKDFVLEYSMDYCTMGYDKSLSTGLQRTMGGTTNCIYYNGDIIDINIAKDGKAICSRIPKLQLSGEERWYSSFKLLPYEDKLLVFYNDDPDNVSKDINKKPDDVKDFTKTAFVMATIDKDGKVTKEILFKVKDKDIIPAIKASIQLDKNRIGIYGVLSSPKDITGILTMQ